MITTKVKAALAAVVTALLAIVALVLRNKQLQGKLHLEKMERVYDKSKQAVKENKDKIVELDRAAKEAELNYRNAVRNHRKPKTRS